MDTARGDTGKSLDLLGLSAVEKNKKDGLLHDK